MEPLRLEVIVEAPLDLVWLAWTETERITEWFAPAANIVPVEEGAYELFFDPVEHTHMSTIGCVITAIEPMERLVFTWKGPDQFAQLMNEPVPATSVEVTFQMEKDRTRVLVEHSGWGNGYSWNEAWEWHNKAWEEVLQSLVSGMESGEGLLWYTPEDR
jgi:uncharacterized protein YndB with AHSA1/START domain